MDLFTFRKLEQMSMTPQAREKTIVYLSEHLGKFLKPRECVMLAFREHKEGNISWLMEQAALRIDVEPVIWGPDHRWSTLLRQAYFSRVSAVIGSPMVILGLMKLKRNNNTPLPIRKVVTSGYPCPQWMIDGIVKGLDCELGGCFGIGESGIVAGFACGHSWGVHLRQDVFSAEIVDAEGNPLPKDQRGEIVLYPRQARELRLSLGDSGRIASAKCGCGSDSIRLLDMELGSNIDRDLYTLGQDLLLWTSILDCRIRKGEYGLELEIVCFAGEKLPKFPTAAKLVVRAFDPKTDEPFWEVPGMRNPMIF